MASINLDLARINGRFPEYRHQITELYHTSDLFRSICIDYAACLGVVERLNTLNRMVEKGYKEEYEQILMELETELLSKLKTEKLSNEENFID